MKYPSYNLILGHKFMLLERRQWKKITWNVKHRCGATAFVHFFIFLSLSCGYSKSEMVSGVWTMISYTLGQVAWGIATAYYLVTVLTLCLKNMKVLTFFGAICNSFLIAKKFSKMSANYTISFQRKDGRSKLQQELKWVLWRGLLIAQKQRSRLWWHHCECKKFRKWI